MTLRQIKIDNRVRYVSENGYGQSEQTPPISKERKKNAFNMKLSQKNKKFIQNITATGFRIIK